MEIKNYSAYNEKEILKLYSSVGWTAGIEAGLSKFVIGAGGV